MKQLVLAAVLLAPIFAHAQGLSANTDIVPGAVAQPKGPDLSDIGIDQKLDSQVPLNLAFTDESGNPVTLQKYFTNKPVILNLVYYQCAMLCPEVLNGITEALKGVTFRAGKDYEIVTVSFDPRDTPQISSQKKARVIADLGIPGAAAGWHFLTGNDANIRALANSVGFKYRWDPDSKQYFHATGIMVLTPSGRVSKYFYGVDFKPADLRFGLIQASNHRIGTLVDAVLLFCCRYNPRSGKYDWLASRLLSIGGAITLLSLGGFMLFMFKTQPKRAA
jgi:protein SCO1/2